MACTIDFRCLDEGFGGKTAKRKRESQSLASETAQFDASMEVDNDNDNQIVNPPAKRAAISSTDDPNKPVFGRPTYDGVIAGRVSGRNWKQPRKHRSSAMAVSRKPVSLEQKKRDKELKKAYKERKDELKEEIRQHKIAKRKQKEEREKKKEENILKSGTKFQKITNPKTLKKIAKSKQRKQLKVNDYQGNHNQYMQLKLDESPEDSNLSISFSFDDAKTSLTPVDSSGKTEEREAYNFYQGLSDLTVDRLKFQPLPSATLDMKEYEDKIKAKAASAYSLPVPYISMYASYRPTTCFHG